MSTAAIVTLVGAGLLIAALAVYLIVVAVVLRRVIRTLGLVTFGVRSIAHQTEPVNELVGRINQDLGAVDDALAELLSPEHEEA